MVSHPCAGLGAPRTPRLSLCAACPRENSYAARAGGSFATAAAAGGGSAEGRAPSEVFALTPMPAPPGCAVVWAPFSTRFSFAVGGAAPAEGESTLPAWGGRPARLRGGPSGRPPPPAAETPRWLDRRGVPPCPFPCPCLRGGPPPFSAPPPQPPWLSRQVSQPGPLCPPASWPRRCSGRAPPLSRRPPPAPEAAPRWAAGRPRAALAAVAGPAAGACSSGRDSRTSTGTGPGCIGGTTGRTPPPRALAPAPDSAPPSGASSA